MANLRNHAKKEKLTVVQMCAVDFTARQFLKPLSRRLMEEGFDVYISCAKGPYFAEMENEGFLLIDNPISRNANIVSHWKSYRKTVKLFKEMKVDVLHVHTPIAALIGRLAAKTARVPTVIYTAHGFYFHDNTLPIRKKLLVLLEKIGAKCGDFIMCVSSEDAQSAVDYRIADKEQIAYVGNGVNIKHYDPKRFSINDRIQLRETYGIPEDAPVFGIMGRLVKEKGFFEFFEAAAIVKSSFPEAKFLVVGDLLPSDYDGSKNEMKARIEELKLKDSIIFAGMVDDPAPSLACMDVFCLPSYREGMPISLMEAMSMGIPCIATDIRGCREEVVDGVTGFLVPVGDPKQLADKMAWMLNNQDAAARMGGMGRRRVLDNFDINSVVQRQLDIYNKLLSDKSLT